MIIKSDTIKVITKIVEVSKQIKIWERKLLAKEQELKDWEKRLKYEELRIRKVQADLKLAKDLQHVGDA